MRAAIFKKPLLLTFCSIFILSSCSDFSTDEKEKKEKEVYKVPVETTELLIQDITNTYRTTAVLEAKAESKVTNKVTGMIEEMLVEEGMFVNKGQVLAEIDSESYQLDYERASIDLASAKAEYNRSKPINGKQIISAKDLEKLDFLVQSRKNQQTVAALKVRDSSVIAPISGVVAQRMVKAGNMTSNAGSEMFHIVALDTLQGVVYLPESEMNNIKIGQKAQLVFPTNTLVNIPATVALISPIIDTESGTFKVTLMVDNDGTKLKPGMFAKVSLILDVHSNAQIVEQKALLVTDTETSIFVIRDNKAKKVIVETGYEQNGLVEILTKLNEKETIVIVGQQGLKVDSPVKIIGAASEMDEKPVKGNSNEAEGGAANAANETTSSE
jgi:membrane fusion protein (multidrug efflux system)